MLPERHWTVTCKGEGYTIIIHVDDRQAADELAERMSEKLGTKYGVA